MSEGENMFAFQVCNIPKTDQKIIHCEFLGIIAEEEEEDDEQEDEDNKRGELRAVMMYNPFFHVSTLIYDICFRLQFIHFRYR